MRRRAADYRRPVRRRLSQWIWALLGMFLIAGLVLFVFHHYHHEDQIKQPIEENLERSEPINHEVLNFTTEILSATSFSRQLAEQMTLAKAYVIIAKEHNNLHLAWELSKKIRSCQLLLSRAAMRGQPITLEEAEPIISSLSYLIFKAQDAHYDVATTIMTMKSHIQALEERANAATVQSTVWNPPPLVSRENSNFPFCVSPCVIFLCMAVSLLAREVSDLCLGKPALRSLAVSATVGEALSALKRSGDRYLSVWNCDHRSNASSRSKVDVSECRCIGKVCMVDVICFLCKEENLKNPAAALQASVSTLVPKALGLVRHLEPHSSLLEAIDLMLEGAQNIVIPIHSPFSRKKLIQRTSSNSTLHNNREYCWLTQEDIIRYLLNCIGFFSPIPNYTIESLNIIDAKSILAVSYDDPASSALPLISQSLVKQTSVAIVDIDGKLIGEISPYALNSCNESVAAAIATLSAGDLMAYIDCGDPPEDLIRLVKERLEERNLGAAVELMEEEWGSSSSSSASYSSSSDEEFGMGKSRRLSSHSIKVTRNTDAIMCFPWSSLVAVMIQALSHRVSFVWVVDEDGTLVGVVTFTGMLQVFRERLNAM